jgi:hypothetical protein
MRGRLAEIVLPESAERANREAGRWPGLAVVLLVALVFAGLFAWLATLAIDNYWLVRAFDVDESGVLADLWQMLAKGSWKPLNYIYGSAHTYLTLILARLWGVVDKVDFSALCIAARLVNALALVGIGLLFSLPRSLRLSPRWSLLLLTTLTFAGLNFSYALNSKPELLQAFFVVAALVAFRAHLSAQRLRRLVLAGALTGAAFATKYAGLLLLAFLTLCLCLSWLEQRREHLPLSALAKQLAALLGGALLGVALLGPYLLIDYRIVAQVLGIHSTIIGKGFLFLDGKQWYDWFNLLLSRDAFWWVLLIGLIPAAVLAVVRLRRPAAGGECASRQPRLLPQLLFALWCLFYLTYLFVMVREKAPRYLIILLPFCYYLLFAGLSEFDRWLRRRGQGAMAAALYLVSAGVVLCVAVSGVSRSGESLLARATAPRVQAGEWLAAQAESESIIASDLYTYVPPTFQRHLHKAYLTAYDVMRARPDYLVVSRTIMSRYLDASRAESYREGRDAFMRHYYLYARLDGDRFPGYRRLKDFDEVVIFGRSR